MGKTRLALFLLGSLILICPRLLAQDKAKPTVKTKPTSLKIQVVVSENEGEKKRSNLPYTFLVRADYNGPGSPYTKVRIGSRIPVYAGKDGGMQYIDVGTNIDARATSEEDGQFDIIMNVERSWVEGDVLLPVEKVPGQTSDSSSAQFKEPIIRQLRTDFTMAMRDGQTLESSQAADPLSGRVVTITVTMNVVK